MMYISGLIRIAKGNVDVWVNRHKQALTLNQVQKAEEELNSLQASSNMLEEVVVALEWKDCHKQPMPKDRDILVKFIWDDGNETQTQEWPVVINYDEFVYHAFLGEDNAFNEHGEPIDTEDIRSNACIGITHWKDIECSDTLTRAKALIEEAPDDTN